MKGKKAVAGMDARVWIRDMVLPNLGLLAIFTATGTVQATVMRYAAASLREENARPAGISETTLAVSALWKREEYMPYNPRNDLEITLLSAIMNTTTSVDRIKSTGFL
jgi:hypothetical protein